MRSLVSAVLFVASCGDDLLTEWTTRESAVSFCRQRANDNQVVDQDCAPCNSNWEAVYSECMAKFTGSAEPVDAGTKG